MSAGQGLDEELCVRCGLGVWVAAIGATDNLRDRLRLWRAFGETVEFIVVGWCGWGSVLVGAAVCTEALGGLSPPQGAGTVRRARADRHGAATGRDGKNSGASEG